MYRYRSVRQSHLACEAHSVGVLWHVQEIIDDIAYDMERHIPRVDNPWKWGIQHAPEKKHNNHT